MTGEELFPKFIGRYEILRPLGTGAYGHAYLVRSPSGDEYAAKWLRSDPAEGGALRFKNEVWALQSLNHRCIPKLIEHGQVQDRPYIVMTFARGETLRTVHRRQMAEQAPISQLRMLTIAEDLLDALQHMHGKEICHRDVKDDNVIVTGSTAEVMLIDVGVCKGLGQPVDALTFWHAGASRFSPPSKLQFPSEACPAHDVFAIGVLGYALLTNQYPWSVGASEDRGHLEQYMRGHVPQPIRSLNPFVDREVSEFFGQLIDIDDRRRPSTAQAIEELERIRDVVERRKVPGVVSTRQAIQFPRVVRDPVHGDIPMTEFEWRVMGTREFQRLRRIRQLGLSHLVFPGAEHTRFTHAIGTMHLADRILTRIADRSGVPFDKEERLMARAFALIHDVTHIACGHTLEDELNIFLRHDMNEPRTNRLVFSDSSELGQVFGATEYGRVILAHLDPNTTIATHSWLRELIEAPVGADVLDYVDRDALFCGLDHRVDSAIFRRYSIQSRSGTPPQKGHLVAKLHGRHGFRLDAEFAILSLLRERFALFLKVYTHPTKTAAGAMLGKAVYAALSGRARQITEQRIEELGDDELLATLAASQRKVSQKLASMIRGRKLYKAAFRAQALGPTDRSQDQYEARRRQWSDKGLFVPAERARLESELAKSAGVDSSELARLSRFGGYRGPK